MNAIKRGGHPCQEITAGELSQNNLSTWRTIRAVKSVAASKGLHGDAFGDQLGDVHRIGTINQEFLMVEIYLDTPPLFRRDKELVRQVARNIVMTADMEGGAE